jgi:ribonuclease Z
MRPLFHPRLIHGPFGDPGLYVRRLYQRTALLFDVGDLHGLGARDLLKVSHVFVSHTHMDHFIGFDQLVRLMLGRPKRIRVFGPAPLLPQLASRLASYSWNLVGSYDERLVLEVTQLHGDCLERAVLDCRDGFRQPVTEDAGPFHGWICEEPTFKVRAVLLDHKIPSMGFCLEEPRHVQILKGKLQAHGLSPGPWLRGLREAILMEERDDRPVAVAPLNRGPLPLGWLRDHLVRISPGQRIAYVADAGCTEENRDRIRSLASGADVLFIEAAFLEEDRDRADSTAHLTALQAGRIAEEAGVKRVVPFHFSPKYEPDAARLLAEVERGFREGGNTGCRGQGSGKRPWKNREEQCKLQTANCKVQIEE